MVVMMVAADARCAASAAERLGEVFEVRKLARGRSGLEIRGELRQFRSCSGITGSLRRLRGVLQIGGNLRSHFGVLRRTRLLQLLERAGQLREGRKLLRIGGGVAELRPAGLRGLAGLIRRRADALQAVGEDRLEVVGGDVAYGSHALLSASG